MSRWWRSYSDTHRNAKIAALSDADFRLWHQLCCIASENDGLIPPLESLKSLLKRRLDHLSCAIDRLVKGGLIDPSENGYSPHNWLERQYKSDCSTDRVKRFRNGGRNVSETPPDTDTDTEKKKEMPAKAGSYAFFGKTIKLKPHDLERWRRTYHSIGDLEAELASLDAWFEKQSPEKRKDWFYITVSSLNKRHQENVANRRDYDPDRITV